MANTAHTHARTHSPSVDVFSITALHGTTGRRRVVSRPITPEIHLLSLTIFAQEVLVTLICMNLSDTHVQITCGCRPASVASVADGMGGESCLLPAPSLGRSRHLAWRYKLPFKLLRRSDGRWRWPVGDRAATVVLSFLAFKKYLGRIEMRTRDKKYLGRISQFETSPEAIEPELRTAFCERRQTDLRQIIG